MKTNRKLTLALTCAAGLLASSGEALAVNWLKMQGTEPPGVSARARVWGFIQPEYQQTEGTKLQAGAWKGQKAIFNMSRPDLKTRSGFNVIRARIGVRGTGFPLDNNVNYFFLAEFGNNGITRQGGGNVKITDASVTLNQFKGARIRVGQFKTPGSEEGLKAIHVFDYINFSTGVNQLLLERFFDGNGSGTPGNGATTGSGVVNRPNGPVGAFRDIGVQVFDWFTMGNWEHTYALMLGNGNGITRGDNDGNREVYAYWASELLFAGASPFPSGTHLAPPSWSADQHGPRGARYQSLKLFGWYQGGKRTLTGEGAGEYDRTRSGLGLTLRKGKIRAAVEYFKAEGMIFSGTDGGAVAGATANNGVGIASYNVETMGEANSWYLDFGYLIHPKLELDIRYDVLNRNTNVSAKERKFDTLTLGAQYFFNKKSRLLVNYEMRNASAPGWSSSATPNQILDSMDNRMSAQLLIVF
ncbi:MAG TPA: porin [Gammaproteobacteria bacterium]|nr:porin [Gammaproteobacteria bacterium]